MRITANIRFSFPPRSPAVSAVVVERTVSVVTDGAAAVSVVAVVTVVVEVVAMTEGDADGAVDDCAEAVTGTDEFGGDAAGRPGALVVVFVAAAVIEFVSVLVALLAAAGDGIAVTTGFAECVAVIAAGAGADVLAEDVFVTVVLDTGAAATTAFV